MNNRVRILFKYQENKIRSIALFELFCMRIVYAKSMCAKIFDTLSMFFSKNMYMPKIPTKVWIEKYNLRMYILGQGKP